MATITINITDETANDFRKYVKHKIGQQKGTLGKVIETALKHWLKEQRQEQIAKEMIELMETGINMGSLKITSRSELHERR